MSTDRLVAFMHARMDELEAVARAATQGRWFWADPSESLDPQGSGELMADGGGWETCQHFCQWAGEENLHRGTPGVPGHEHRVAEIVVGSWGYDAHCVVVGEADRAHIAHHDPARVLADVAAKRALIAAVAGDPFDAMGAEWRYEQCVLLHLAQSFSDHPEFDAAWKLDVSPAADREHEA